MTTARASGIGFSMAVALVMGNMIGSGVFLLPASLAPFGGVSLLGWVVSTAGSLLLALVFAHLARFNPSAGGPYAYTRQAFGDLAGFLIAWGYWISTWCTNAALSVAFVGYLEPFAPTIVRHPPSAAAAAIATLWLLTTVNLRGVRAAGQVQLATTVLKIVPLVVIGLAGLLRFQPAHFAMQAEGTRALAGQVSQTATLTLWAFLGLECATIVASSVREPERSVPRATIVGTLLTAMIYIASTVGVMSLLDPATLSRSTAPFADAARTVGGEGAARFIALGAAVSCFGALNGWVLVAGQLPLAVARDGLFPPVFGRVSAGGTPAAGILIAAVLSTALIAMNSARGLVDLFTFIILLATLSTLVPYAFCAAAGFVLRGPAHRLPWSPALSFVSGAAFLYAIWAIGGAGHETVYWGFLLLMAGLPVYVGVARS
jgi:APA family basic amino acid/polyamine antiporter